MNIQKVRKIIESYKLNFEQVHDREIYKWQAVQCFQNHWNIEADNFLETLEESLSSTGNLLVSAQYYPKEMLLRNTKIDAAFVRRLFHNLYNEDLDLIERITTFREDFNKHSRTLIPEAKNSYQDLRAIVAYLCLRYPDRYYFYKFGMVKEFAALIDYPSIPKKGNDENIIQYLTLCNILKAEILKDNELLELHKGRLKKNDYLDESFNILTQDVIYAAVKYLKIEGNSLSEAENATLRLIKTERRISIKATKEIILKGKFTNYIENEKVNKKIGDLGELLVLGFEQEKLKRLGIKKFPVHKSKTEGDGLGYDILSYDEKGKEIFIEVKTSTTQADTPFYITANELEKSIRHSCQFYLYRLYEFDEINMSAKFYSIHGALTDLCINPILYRVEPMNI